MNKIYRRRCITAFQITKCDLLSDAFTMGLKIKQQNGIAVLKKQFRAIHHAEPVRMNSMHQNDRAFSGLTNNEPAANFRTAGAGKFNRLNRQGFWRITNRTICRSNQNAADVPDKNDTKNRSGKK